MYTRRIAHRFATRAARKKRKSITGQLQIARRRRRNFLRHGVIFLNPTTKKKLAIFHKSLIGKGTFFEKVEQTCLELLEFLICASERLFWKICTCTRTGLSQTGTGFWYRFFYTRVAASAVHSLKVHWGYTGDTLAVHWGYNPPHAHRLKRKLFPA